MFAKILITLSISWQAFPREESEAPSIKSLFTFHSCFFPNPIPEEIQTGKIVWLYAFLCQLAFPMKHSTTEVQMENPWAHQANILTHSNLKQTLNELAVSSSPKKLINDVYNKLKIRGRNSPKEKPLFLD